MTSASIKGLLFLAFFLATCSPVQAYSGFGQLLQQKNIHFGDLLPAPPATPSPIPTPKPETLKQAKNSYKIAVFGDSMVDTMGENLEYLQKALKRRYPSMNFYLYNYGIGSQNAEMGLMRFGSYFSYKTRNFPPLSLLLPDIIVLGSFSYNPFFPYDRNKHWIALSRLLGKAKATGAEVYLLAEIAPLESGFGQGPKGINWSEGLAHEHSLHIIEQLENTVGLAKITGTPLINAFEKSKKPGSNFGKPVYANRDDGIHPSVAGHTFIANLIAETIKLR